MKEFRGCIHDKRKREGMERYRGGGNEGGTIKKLGIYWREGRRGIVANRLRVAVSWQNTAGER